MTRVEAEHRHAEEQAMPRRVALVTCRELPNLDEDTRHLIGPLAARGIAVTAAAWDDPEVDWNGFDLAVVRSCWDYASRRGEFLEWAARVPYLANPAAVLAWNTHKGYLRDLAGLDVPIVPTTWLDSMDGWTPPERGEWVIKPTVSLASLDTGRYRTADRDQRRLAVEHVRRLHADGRAVMLQPYMHAIDSEGETSLVFLGGVFSHAMRKGAVLTGPDVGVDRRFLPQGGLQLRAHRPTAQEMATAKKALLGVPPDQQLLYARVDLVSGPDGLPVLMELELTEPQLFFRNVPEAADRMAAAIDAQLQARAGGLRPSSRREGGRAQEHEGGVLWPTA